MENESVLKMLLSNRINSGNLNTAINAQRKAVNALQPISFSNHFINRRFREGGYDFSFHLHTDKSLDVDDSVIEKELGKDFQRGAVLEYVRRSDISILMINATLLNPALRFYLNSDIVPRVLLRELMAILQERYVTFNGSAESGMVILLTGSMDGSGCRLEAQLLEFAHLNNVEPEFLDWIEDANFFCNILMKQLVSLCRQASPYMPFLISNN